MSDEPETPPQGTLTLPLDFGRAWLGWFIEGVNKAFSIGRLGPRGTLYQCVHGCKVIGLAPIEKRATAVGDKLLIHLTAEELPHCYEFTKSTASKPENVKAFYDAITNDWQPVPTPEDAAAEKQIKRDAARLRKEEAGKPKVAKKTNLFS